MLQLGFCEYAQMLWTFFSTLIFNRIWTFMNVWWNLFKKNLSESRSVLCHQKKMLIFFFPSSRKGEFLFFSSELSFTRDFCLETETRKTCLEKMLLTDKNFANFHFASQHKNMTKKKKWILQFWLLPTNQILLSQSLESNSEDFVLRDLSQEICAKKN